MCILCWVLLFRIQKTNRKSRTIGFVRQDSAANLHCIALHCFAFLSLACILRVPRCGCGHGGCGCGWKSIATRRAPTGGGPIRSVPFRSVVSIRSGFFFGIAAFSEVRNVLESFPGIDAGFDIQPQVFHSNVHYRVRGAPHRIIENFVFFDVPFVLVFPKVQGPAFLVQCSFLFYRFDLESVVEQTETLRHSLGDGKPHKVFLVGLVVVDETPQVPHRVESDVVHGRRQVDSDFVRVVAEFRRTGKVAHQHPEVLVVDVSARKERLEGPAVVEKFVGSLFLYALAPKAVLLLAFLVPQLDLLLLDVRQVDRGALGNVLDFLVAGVGPDPAQCFVITRGRQIEGPPNDRHQPESLFPQGGDRLSDPVQKRVFPSVVGRPQQGVGEQNAHVPPVGFGPQGVFLLSLLEFIVIEKCGGSGPRHDSPFREHGGEHFRDGGPPRFEGVPQGEEVRGLVVVKTDRS
mmetsp:Transcript_120406/g.246080  ORF Transcript_120406/g.246080 Transcript_120406/m.246080 type:complete len:460 (+) Transcript_120406:122-1501(+)